YAADPNHIISVCAEEFIDTTGTAALAHMAGAQTVRGNEDGAMQTASTFFIISGVDKKVLDAHMAEHSDTTERFFMNEIEEGKKNGTFPCGTNKLRIFENPDGTWNVNMAQIDEPICELDAEAVTLAEIGQREQIAKIIEFLRKNIPGLENIRLVATASDIGIRESRRIVGRSVLTLDDMRSAKKFEDRIAVCANSIDMHGKNGVSYTAHEQENYYIPLSCLISKDIENLLTAGKTLSADRYAFAAVRVMPPCVAMGEAAGVTAALAAKENTAAGDVPCAEVQNILLQNGAYLG
ncbi:MAG: FAD-dependent oxidoreductase, partial [Clostridia bacterium]|nr:FAD-dependent oxidoreductase [Clostridia bacterium]